MFETNRKAEHFEKTTYIYIYIKKNMYIFILLYIYMNRTTYSGSCSGSSSGAPTSPVGGALGRPGRGAAATAAAGAVCCSMIMYIYTYIILLLRNLLPFFENITFSKKINSSFRKYDVFVRKYNLQQENRLLVSKI